jgi:dolichyl-phosphate beta-glucosyltransferase
VDDRSQLRLSVVISAYNEHRRLGPTLVRVLAYLRERGDPFEVIVVDDGSADDTAAIAARALAPLGEHGRVLRRERNRGKGTAIRRGMLAARGDRVLFCDADLSTPIEEIEKLERALASGARVAIGSRALDRTLIERPQPWLRDRAGRLFNVVVRLVAVPGVFDTQCGFKLFAADAVHPIFSRQRVDGFGFDVELVAIARLLGLGVAEVPVRWINDPESKVSLLQGARAFLDPLRVRLGLLRGVYGEPAPLDDA